MKARPAGACLAVLLGALVASGMGGCRDAADTENIVPASAIVLQADSHSSWRAPDTSGQIRSVGDFAGRALAIYFGFTHCPNACPTAMAKLAAARSMMGSDAAKLQVALVSVDPQRDTTKRLSSYVRGFDPTFIGLRPEGEELQALKDVFRVYSRASDGNPDYQVEHSGLIYLIGCDGVPRLGFKPEVIVEELLVATRALLEEVSCQTQPG